MSAAQKHGELKEAWRMLREIIASLRSFLETDDYSRIDEAYRICEELSASPVSSELSGLKDLAANLSEMKRRLEARNYSPNTIEHGLLVQQAVYAISRANIIATGLEFLSKRARGG
ncbi:MAG: hypothetical protein RQ798_02515 [Candidatus Caldarchaeales archaeon]|nr:hypothetical protein [Candidatus Caldarchaeales archaeon]MDT7915394.1 hypothetical protein [Candidatus Caldarchaeales archaeon]